MDPDANLREQRELTRDMNAKMVRGVMPSRDQVARLMELGEAMDTWLRRGGCLPSAWSRAQASAHGPTSSPYEDTAE